MNRIILGNCITFAGSLIMTAQGLVKERKNIILVQILMYVVLGAGMLVLGGVTGAMVDFVGIVRNIYTLKHELTAKAKIVFIGMTVILTAVFNQAGLMGWLPALTGMIVTWTISSKDEVVMKTGYMGSTVLWAFYDISIRNYTTFVFDIATIISSLIGIWRVKTGRKKAGTENTDKQ